VFDFGIQRILEAFDRIDPALVQRLQLECPKNLVIRLAAAVPGKISMLGVS
jgi:Flp pilus assembly CpaE family ATPase